MIRLPNKGNCKRKVFNKALVIGHYVYLEFINSKTTGDFWGLQHRARDLTPRPKILKVVERNELKLVYIRDKDENWKTIEELWDEDFSKQSAWLSEDHKPKRFVYTAHNIWSWFQRDEVRNIRVMTREELLAEYMTEFI